MILRVGLKRWKLEEGWSMSEHVKSFEESAKPLIAWLNENKHPHSYVIVRTNGAEVVEGVLAISTDEFIED